MEKKWPRKKGDIEFNKEQKKKVREMARKFVDVGEPGEVFKPAYEQMLAKLEIPELLKKQLNPLHAKEMEFLLEHSRYYLQRHRYSLIPSFFKLVERLKEEKRDFVVVFRSFGHDLKDVIAEFNAYFLLDRVGIAGEDIRTSRMSLQTQLAKVQERL